MRTASLVACLVAALTAACQPVVTPVGTVTAPSAPVAPVSTGSPAAEVTSIPTLPYEIASCEALTHGYGSWVPSRAALLSASATATTSVCYNYFELDPKRLSATLDRCADHAETNTVRVALALGDNQCELEVRSATLEGRT